MKRLSAVLLLACAPGLAACGGSKPAPAPVRLTVAAPADMALARTDAVEVHGIVSPASARVLVEGRTAHVRDGRWSASVPLLPGTNLVDVIAGAPRARPAMVAVRVRREVTVTVPDLTNYTPSDATDRLAALGLHADVQKAKGLIELLLPLDAHVCSTNPPAGTDVDPGSTVTVVAAKRC